MISVTATYPPQQAEIHTNVPVVHPQCFDCLFYFPLQWRRSLHPSVVVADRTRLPRGPVAANASVGGALSPHPAIQWAPRAVLTDQRSGRCRAGRGGSPRPLYARPPGSTRWTNAIARNPENSWMEQIELDDVKQWIAIRQSRDEPKI